MMSQILALRASLVAETVSFKDGDVQLEGFLAYQSHAVGPLPVVIHVHTWAGLTDFERGRANRTAEELGYIGLAVSIFDANQAAKAAEGMQNRIGVVGEFRASPDWFKTRLSAAVSFIKTHAKANPSAIAAVGYCFGGSSVLQFARLGGAKESGVSGVVSFHGALSDLDASPQSWDGTKVVVLNGAADAQIPKADIDTLQQSLSSANTFWEFTNYGRAGHGFTHPEDGTDHFHYEKVAEERSWHSMSDFLENSLGFKVQGTDLLENTVETEDVTYEDAGVSLTGYIASPADVTGPLPVLLHVHGWKGLSEFEKKRADDTAKQFGYIGFAVSIFDADESTKAAASMQDRMSVTGKFNSDPELFKSRLGAAVAFAKTYPKADSSKIAAAGYCFGGSAVLQYARLGGAGAHGVSSVISFHGGLRDLVNRKSNFCPTRVAVYNGASDPMITDSDLVALQDALETTGTQWELTNYSFAAHGFTHPTEEGNDHYHFEEHAEARSWKSMHQHLEDSFAGKGRTAADECVEYTPSTTDTSPDEDSSGDCADDNAAVKERGGAWGVNECSTGLCEGQYASMMKPLCKKTCGLCDAMTTTATTMADTQMSAACTCFTCVAPWLISLTVALLVDGSTKY